ncbi:MAG: FAD-binding protein [Clostridiaceae bacterium]|nr:FAD-binding protein [Clostridiaceae bacterium]
MIYDLIIIGSGPAGISASLYAKRANLNVLIISKEEGNLKKAEKIENYYGLEDSINGKELQKIGEKQAKN